MDTDTPRRLYSVTELTREIRDLLEMRFPFIWISGEISNCRRPVSGHCYFTLKDQTAQIGAVLFRGQAKNLRFTLADGLRVSGIGRISVYEPRGTYQIIFEYLEPGGVGALQIAFEQLKKKLADEGLFDESRKRPLPLLPRMIGLVTSPTGAVVHDILSVAKRRFPNIPIQVAPVTVQGPDAAESVVAAIDLLNRMGGIDVMIVARGGGSLEDLQAFNDERVARAVFNSAIPVVSAVGHQTDFTICDFAADFRAPTPSAAAESVVPLKIELTEKIQRVAADIAAAATALVSRHRHRVEAHRLRLGSPHKQIQRYRLKLDDLAWRLAHVVQKDGVGRRRHFDLWVKRLNNNNPNSYIKKYKEKINYLNDNITKYIRLYIYIKRQAVNGLAGRLDALNPRAVLARGYSITRRLPDGRVVRDPNSVREDQPIEIIVEKGTLRARVEI